MTQRSTISPDRASAFEEVPAAVRQEIEQTYNTVAKSERDYAFDLHSEEGRVTLLKRTAQRLGYSDNDAVAFSMYVTEHPDLYSWIQSAPAVQARPRPEVEKSEPRTVRRIVAEKFEELAKREQCEGESYEQSYCRMLTGTRGRELYDLYSHPKATQDPAAFLAFLKRWDPEFAKTAVRVIYS